jgi:hypothetical protein
VVQSIKAVCGLVILVSIVAGGVAWLAGQPDADIWRWRIGSVGAIVVASAVIGLFSLRRDEAPDYLYLVSPKYVSRNGFCFALSVERRDRLCLVCVHYQNQHENPCQVTVAFRRVLDRSKRETDEPTTVEIDCPPAGFGVVRVPFPVPLLLQGSTQHFQVGATVDYPEGKGKRLLKRDGLLLRTNADFADRMNDFVRTTALVQAGLNPVGQILFNRNREAFSRVLASVSFPTQVASRPQEVEELMKAPEHKLLWQLGDPLLDDERRLGRSNR